MIENGRLFPVEFDYEITLVMSRMEIVIIFGRLKTFSRRIDAEGLSLLNPLRVRSVFPVAENAVGNDALGISL